MKHLITLFLLLGLTCPGVLYALQPLHPASLQIDIVSDDGRIFPVYALGSEEPATRRAFLEAEYGREYGIRVRNNSHMRRGLVIAVDGRNIISGEKSELAHDERMYILEPWQSATYRGWRTSKDRINRFYFTEAGDSYAAAWQDHSAMGVIAVAAFNPRHQHRSNSKRLSRDKGAARNRPAEQDAMAASEGLYEKERREAGTGFGKEQYSHARVVAFAPQRRASERHFFKYEWRETLCRKAVIDCGQEAPNRFWPRPELGFAPYPPGH